MITTAQAQSFGGAWGCCEGPKHEDDTFTGFLILAVVLVCAVIFARDWWNERSRRRTR